ncbi:hypothetical protein ABK040_011951 [Willaertia magna]
MSKSFWDSDSDSETSPRKLNTNDDKGAKEMMKSMPGLGGFFKSEASALFEFMKTIREIDESLYQELDLPRIVVIGIQSAGKSSLLRRLIGMNIIPIDHNTCTRCPLEITIKYKKTLQYNYNIIIKDHKKEHKDYEKACQEESEVRNEIADHVQNIATSRKPNVGGYSEEPIYITVETKLIDAAFSFTDLPGVINNREAESRFLKKIIEKYISKENTIIIWSIDGTVDLKVDSIWTILESRKSSAFFDSVVGVCCKWDKLNTEVEKQTIAKFLSNGGKFENVDYQSGSMKWFAVANQQKDLNSKTYNPDEENRNLGIGNLKGHISKLFFRKLQKYFQNEFSDKIKKVKASYEDELKYLGKEVDVNDRFSNLKDSIVKTVKNALVGNELEINTHNTKHIGSLKKLISEINTRIEKLERDIVSINPLKDKESLEAEFAESIKYSGGINSLEKIESPIILKHLTNYLSQIDKIIQSGIVEIKDMSVQLCQESKYIEESKIFELNPGLELTLNRLFSNIGKAIFEETIERTTAITSDYSKVIHSHTDDNICKSFVNLCTQSNGQGWIDFPTVAENGDKQKQNKKISDLQLTSFNVYLSSMKVKFLNQYSTYLMTMSLLVPVALKSSLMDIPKTIKVAMEENKTRIIKELDEPEEIKENRKRCTKLLRDIENLISKENSAYNKILDLLTRK